MEMALELRGQSALFVFGVVCLFVWRQGLTM